MFIGNSDSSRIPVVGGESYVWSWRAYASPGRNYKTAYRWRDAAGKDIGYYYVGSTRYASTSWTYESEVLTAPSTAATLELVWLNISGYGLTLADITVKAQAGAIDIRDGVVTAPKLQAGSIGTRELTANEIRGKTFVGSTYYAADTSSTWNNVKIDSTGVHVYQGGKEMVRLSSDTGTGLSVRSPVSDEMLPLASYVFGSKTFIEGAPVWPSDSGQWHFYDFPGSYQAVARNNMISFGTLISNDTYHVMGTPYFTDQQTGERFEVGKPHRVGIVPITFSQPRALEPGHTYTVGTQYRIIGRNPYPQAPGNPAVSPRIVEIRPIE